GDGGAIATVSFATGATIANSTFYSNYSTGNYGALYLGSTVTITNSTIANNYSSGSTGAISISGNLTLKNTIIAYNSGASCFVWNTPITDGGGNLQWPDNSCSPTISQADPLLDTFGDHGGPTFTMPLQAGSPAIDWGINAICLLAPIQGLDQRGV